MSIMGAHSIRVMEGSREDPQTPRRGRRAPRRCGLCAQGLRHPARRAAGVCVDCRVWPRRSPVAVDRVGVAQSGVSRAGRAVK
jgi:hypothetical protein